MTQIHTNEIIEITIDLEYQQHGMREWNLDRMNVDKTGWEARNRRQQLNQEVGEHADRNAGICCEFSIFVTLCSLFTPVQIYDVRAKMKGVFYHVDPVHPVKKTNRPVKKSITKLT